MTAHPAGEPPTFRIRVQGRLGPEWSDRLGGMKVTAREATGGTVFAELTGPLTDEAALMGVLEHLYNLGLPLLAVERVEIGRTGDG